MNTTTKKLFTPYQRKRAQAFMEDARDAARILCGASEMGLDVPEVEVLASDLLWSNPNERDPAVRLYAPIDVQTGGLEFTVTGILMDGECGRDRKVALSTEPFELSVFEGTDCTTLSPADTAIELTEEDVRHLERTEPLFGDWMHYLRGFVKALTSNDLRFPWPGVHHDGTLYMVANETGDLVVIREDGTILPVGHSMRAPDAELDGEREEIVRPRIEELRA